MTTRERPIDRGRRLADRDRRGTGDEIRTARRAVGLTIRQVGERAGLSAAQAGRIARAVLPSVSVDQLARLGAVVGLDVRVRTYPGPDPTVDAGQLPVLARFRARLPTGVTVPTEVPLPIIGDQRAWDGLIRGLAWPGTGERVDLPFDVEARLTNTQAQVRRLMLKARDSGFEHVLLVLGRTHHNRAALQAAGASLTDSFPISARRALAALSIGEHPGGSAIILV